ncbi:MAG: SDR family oxidoreductase [Eubacteriales bacterium]|nr:SDR family oxidoreductase [Eubacteriales bacterium]
MGIKRNIKWLINKFKVQVKTPVLINVQENDLLKGRVAVITGGSSGIGLAIANAYLRSGATVVITGRNKSKLDTVVKELDNEYHGFVFPFGLDNSEVSNFKNVFEQIEMLVSNKIDILVNNAGISSDTYFLDISEKDYDEVLNINLKGMVFLSQEFANYMIKNQIPGNILNIGSSSGLRPANNPYNIAKWGVRGFTLGIAKQLIKYNIVVNGIAPGPTATPMLTERTDNLSGPMNDSKRYIHTEEIANMAIQLVSNSCRMIIGEMININGGSGTLTFDDVKY